ncbi:hypothetical protein BDZ85DRAFT_74647 [Elsinoe ampelina]|uniref:Uncharacterized protein n=1 Tax=Elsinoe ampelina TaxID=302913 RepID=A0A6A6GK94_9PEZI|nr:hypothetical protein BDZ85DRAFT_74647 [Elsinoe ampelina]
MAGMESLCSRCNVWCQCRRWILRWGWLLGKVERRGTSSLSSRGRCQWTNDEVVEGRGKSRDETRRDGRRMGYGCDGSGMLAGGSLTTRATTVQRLQLRQRGRKGLLCVTGRAGSRWPCYAPAFGSVLRVGGRVRGESRLRLAQPEGEPESAARVREQEGSGTVEPKKCASVQERSSQNEEAIPARQYTKACCFFGRRGSSKGLP